VGSHGRCQDSPTAEPPGLIRYSLAMGPKPGSSVTKPLYYYLESWGPALYSDKARPSVSPTSHQTRPRIFLDSKGVGVPEPNPGCRYE
jgi:hypothetical protein